MKKIRVFTNLIICVSLSLWAIQALLAYNNYTRHVELYAASGWLWYTDSLNWGKSIIPLVIVCLIVKSILQRKMEK